MMLSIARAQLSLALAFWLALPAAHALAQEKRSACSQCGRAPFKHTVIADGHPLTVWNKRPATARRAVLLIHGRRWSSLPNYDLQPPREHRSVMDALAAQGFAVYALDMRGNGATPRDSTGWLTPNRAAADVAVVLDWITRREHPGSGAPSVRPVLVGYSRGSETALLTAQRYPDKLSGLVLYGFPFDIDSVRPVNSDPPRPPRLRNTPEDAAANFITPGAASQAIRDAFVAAALAADPVSVDWGRMQEFNALDPRAVHVPTLVLDGARDPYAAGTSHARLFTRLGTEDRTWVVLPHGDHVAHIENTHTEFVRVIARFLSRPPVAAPGEHSGR